MESEPTRVCERLIGLPDVTVLGAEDEPDAELRVHVECRKAFAFCGGLDSRGPTPEMYVRGERPFRAGSHDPLLGLRQVTAVPHLEAASYNPRRAFVRYKIVERVM